MSAALIAAALIAAAIAAGLGVVSWIGAAIFAQAVNDAEE